MSDKEFTQICKEILEFRTKIQEIKTEVLSNAGQALEKAEEILSIKNTVENLSSKILSFKPVFETKKQDFDEKYSEISILFEQLKQLKGQIEGILQNGLISDNTVSSTTAYSSQKIEQIKSVIESSIQTLTRTQTNLQSQIQSASESINSLNRQVADRYTKREVNDTFLGKTATAADSSKLGGLNASDYRKVADSYHKAQIDKKLEEARKALVNSFINKDKFCAYTNELNLPFGDMNTHAYWRSIKPGFYFSNLSNSGYINKPADLAHFLVLRHPDSSDVQVLCFQHPTGSVLRFMANSGYASGWQSLSKVLGENQTWQDVKNQRQAGMTYTNSTGRPIYVAAAYSTATGGTYGMSIEVDGKVVSGGSNTPPVIVPNNSTYKIILYGTAYIYSWCELR